jgi:4-hydroxythreonine-4-phosphate dehydrogenase
LIKRLLYTCGEPAGIGPDIALLYAQQHNSLALNTHQLVTVADPDLLIARTKKLGLAIKLKEIDLADEPSISQHNELAFIATKATTSTGAGKPSTNNANYILETLDIAIAACQQHQCHGMVTGPIQKSILNDAGIAFSGHTEYLAEKTHTQQVVMMLATEGLRVALATTHLPLNKVSAAITQESLSTTIRILHHDLRVKFGIKAPKILVCGLNPHAGEGGHLGREEIDIIIPTLQQLANENINCHGPLPADTLFTPKYLQDADAVLAMYHDQGLPVLKYKGFGAAANITLGLPIIRTSVDHGTALDLAGTGKVNLGSLSTAISYALQMNIHQDSHSTGISNE